MTPSHAGHPILVIRSFVFVLRRALFVAIEALCERPAHRIEFLLEGGARLCLRLRYRSGLVRKQSLDRALMHAKAFVAAAARKVGVRLFSEAVGIAVVVHFPFDQKRKSAEEQRERPEASDEHQRREHHGIVPVVDTAVRAARVLHDERLEGAPEQDADDVRYGIEHRDDDEDARIDDLVEIKHANSAIERDPEDSYHHHVAEVLLPDLLLSPTEDTRYLFRKRCFRAGLVVLEELLLAAGAFIAVGEEAADHLRNESDPYHDEE